MNFEFIKMVQKDITKAIHSKHAIYTLAISDQKQDVIANLKSLGELAEMVGAQLQDEKIKTDSKDYRVYVKHPDLPDTSYFCFTPHVPTGYNPFLFYATNEDGDEKNHGFLVKMSYHAFDFCSKSINKAAKAIYFDDFQNDLGTSMKEARKRVLNELKSNPDSKKIPIVEKVIHSTFYLDLDKGLAVARSSQHDSTALRAFFVLLSKAAKLSFSDDVSQKRVSALVDKALKEAYFPEDYTQWAISQGQSSGAYDVGSIVDFYAKDDAKGNDACDFSATHSASAYSKEEPDHVAKFNESIGIFTDGDLGDLPSFEKLAAFSKNRAMDFSSLVLVGEIPASEQINEFVKEQPEDQDSICPDGFMEVGFETSAKKGNICFRPKYGTSDYALVSRSLLLNYCNENAVSPDQSESVALKFFGGMLALLHDSTNLFIKLYLNANKIKQEFGVDEAEADDEEVKKAS